jgi:hypothetical protein
LLVLFRLGLSKSPATPGTRNQRPDVVVGGIQLLYILVGKPSVPKFTIK